MALKIKNSLIVLLCTIATLAMSADIIPQASDFSRDIKLVQKRNIPLLVEFSLPGCDYCALLEDEVLQPMIRSGEYEQKVILRKLEVSERNKVIDFSGNKTSGAELADKYNIDIYPTLVFFDNKGKEIGERLVGVVVIDYYFAELDGALQKATDAM